MFIPLLRSVTVGILEYAAKIWAKMEEGRRTWFFRQKNREDKILGGTFFFHLYSLYLYTITMNDLTRQKLFPKSLGSYAFASLQKSLKGVGHAPS